jgi:hypothetical protein
VLRHRYHVIVLVRRADTFFVSGGAIEDLRHVIRSEDHPLAETQTGFGLWHALQLADIVAILEALHDHDPHAFADWKVLVSLNPKHELHALPDLE